MDASMWGIVITVLGIIVSIILTIVTNDKTKQKVGLCLIFVCLIILVMCIRDLSSKHSLYTIDSGLLAGTYKIAKIQGATEPSFIPALSEPPYLGSPGNSTRLMDGEKEPEGYTGHAGGEWWNGGGTYDGYLLNGKRSGWGKYTFTTSRGQEIYEGEWANDRPDGYGQYTLYDGRIYQGNIKNGKCVGLGTLFNKDLTIIVTGEWNLTSQ